MGFTLSCGRAIPSGPPCIKTAIIRSFPFQVAVALLEIILKDVDVGATATRAIMSGTYAVLSFPLAAPGSFVRA